MQKEIQKLIGAYPEWRHDGDALVGDWTFSNFKALRRIVIKLCDLAEELNHHPAVTYGYNTLHIETMTHDVGNVVTEKDTEFAVRVSELVGE